MERPFFAVSFNKCEGIFSFESYSMLSYFNELLYLKNIKDILTPRDMTFNCKKQNFYISCMDLVERSLSWCDRFFIIVY